MAKRLHEPRQGASWSKVEGRLLRKGDVVLVEAGDEVFPLLCPRCREAMTLIGFITEPGSIQRILEHLGGPTRPPPIGSARGPRHEDFDRYEVDAFTSSDPLPLYGLDQRVNW